MNSHVIAIPFLFPALAVGLRSHGKSTVSTEKRSTLGSGYGYNVSLGDSCSDKHMDDIYRPIKQVAHEHPGEDMNCWFHFYADYLVNRLGPTGFVDQFFATIRQFGPSDEGYGPERKIHLTNGEILTTHDDAQAGKWGNYAYDDAMCYQMGWMKGQRLDDKIMKMKSEEEWLKITQEECERLPTLVNRSLTDESSKLMTIGGMQHDHLQRIVDAASCLFEDYDAPCKKATMEDWVVHLYPKCLLGHDDTLTGAAGQIGWCFARACVTEGGVIKHGSDCWPDGPPCWPDELLAGRTSPQCSPFLR